MEERECSVGMLIDISISDPIQELKDSHLKENKENEPIEIARRDSGCCPQGTMRSPAKHKMKSISSEEVIVSPKKKSKESPEVQMLSDEVFDFDLVLSPNGSEHGVEEDEVFFGPIGLTERIVAAIIPVSEPKPLSPLNPAQVAEMVKEAQTVACRIMSMKPNDSSADDMSPIKKQLFHTGKGHARIGTFSMEECSVEGLPDKIHCSMSKVDVDGNCDVQGLRVDETFCRSSASEKEAMKTKERTVKGKEKRSSLLSKLPRNRSFQMLKMADEGSKRVRLISSSSDATSETCSVSSDVSDKSLRKKRQSMQKVLQAPVIKPRPNLQVPSSNISRRSIGPAKNPPTLTSKNLQRSSSSVRTSILPKRHERTNSNSSKSSVGSTSSTASGQGSKVPLKKLQLMQPGKIQNSFAFNRGKQTEVKKMNGPMKAVVPVQTNQAEEGGMKTRSTPVKGDRSSLQSSFSTPVKSGSQSSYGGSTPISGRKMKRTSLLPTPSKSSTSSIPASPYSMRSSISSHSSITSKRSISATDSPVFSLCPSSRRRNTSTSSQISEGCQQKSPISIKSRRPLIQHTPDVPKQTAVLSRWSPLRKSRQISTDEQSMLCTKRLTRKASK